MRAVLTAISAAVALLAAVPAAGAAEADRPDLVIELPGKPYGGQFAPVYLDAFEVSGRLLYRFDAVIANEGGTLDLFDDGTGVKQAIWAGGEPSTDPRPDQLPVGPDAEIVDRSGAGADFTYAIEKTHEHFHFGSAARYELQPAGAAARVSDKVGFCMFDSIRGAYFEYGDQGPGGETWCAFGAPQATTVRMGLSPGGADRYSAQREFQWVDISGLEPGPATLRGEANPLLCILERETANNVTQQARVIPGVRVAAADAATPRNAPVTVALRGEVVAPEVPARRNGSCTPSPASPACYVYASAGTPLRFRVVDPPDHGTVALSESGREAQAAYTPAAGFAGEDAFSYVASDARGLVSPPATVRLRVSAPAALPTPVPAIAERARLSRLRAVRRLGRWRVRFRASAPARLSARIERRMRRRFRTVRRVRARRIGAGPGALVLGRLAPGRYRVRLFLDGQRAGTLALRVRRR